MMKQIIHFEVDTLHNYLDYKLQKVLEALSDAQNATMGDNSEDYM